MSRTTLARTLAPLLLLLGSPALAGCGDSDEEQAERAAEAVLGEDADVDIDGDSMTFEDGGNTITTGTGVPDGFPEDVELVDGEVVSGMGSDGGDGASFTVVVSSPAELTEAADEARSLLEGAGWTVDTENEMEGLTTLRLSKDGTEVGITVLPADSGSGSQVMYTVTPAA